MGVCVCVCKKEAASQRLPAGSEGLLCQDGAPLSVIFVGIFQQKSSGCRRHRFEVTAWLCIPAYHIHTHAHTVGLHLLLCVWVRGCFRLSPFSGRHAAKQPFICLFTLCAGLCCSSSSSSSSSSHLILTPPLSPPSFVPVLHRLIGAQSGPL